MPELIDVKPPREVALLLGAPRKGSVDERRVGEHLKELARLVDTAGAAVCGEIVQALDHPHPATYIGSGKVEEVKQAVGEHGATLVICDEDLAPVQGSNLEKALGVRVMDRTEVILDIFATHARSQESQLQVELAQLQYLLPRLKRMWTHLSRIRGGIGLRGPGETQLEVDRRLIGRRISSLKKRLREVERHRETLGQGREGPLRVTLVGYTNAGKSSILNMLAGQPAAVVQDQLFATLDPLAREVELGAGYRARLVDTVGFIRKLPHHLVASFRGTLSEARQADILVHVIDGSDPAVWEHVDVIERTLAEADIGNKPVISVLNKADLVGGRSQLEEVARSRLGEWVFATATDQGGVDALRDHLLGVARVARPEVRLRVPSTDGALFAAIHRSGEVVCQTMEDEMVVITVRMSRADLSRIERAGGTVLPDAVA